ncbi:uncharacterized protein LOC127841663 [Dreissena polymorpha]|nr:uncharacterized protein LOC127841663 [Dreissena polymorpha]
MPCRCDEARCYHGSPSEFGCLYRECGNDAELDPYTGECKQCGPLRFKKDVCGYCLVNETAWRLSEKKRIKSTNKDISAEQEHIDSPDIIAVITDVHRNSELYLVDTKVVPSEQASSLSEEDNLYRTSTSINVNDDLYRTPNSPSEDDDLYRKPTIENVKDDLHRTVLSIAVVFLVILNTVLIVLLIRRNLKKKRTPSQVKLLKDSQHISHCTCKGIKATFGCLFCTVAVCECRSVSFV